jgi:hypothetical protein
MGYLVLAGYITLSDKLAFEGDFWDWTVAAVSQLLISLVMMLL